MRAGHMREEKFILFSVGLVSIISSNIQSRPGC